MSIVTGKPVPAMYSSSTAAALLAILVFVQALSAQDAAPVGRESVDFTHPLISTDPVKPKDVPAESVAAMETAVLRAHDAMVAAAEALDLDRLFEGMLQTNRGAMIVDGQLTLTRDDVIATTRRNFADIAKIHYEYVERHVTLLSPTSAIITGTGHTRLTRTTGETSTSPFTQTLVFMLVDKSWKVIHMHSSTPRPSLGG